MKTRLLLQWGFIWMAAATILSSCGEDEETKTIPEITTSAVTDVTATSATGGGEITSDGNTEITTRGLVYSSTTATPTLSDSKTEATGTDDSFTSDLEGLTSGIMYHVRAYATNSVGTGYGEVIDFTTNNMAPTAANVVIDGTVEVDQEVTADYDYDDAEDDAESGTTFQWYVANDLAGSGEVAIEGAIAASYMIDVNYEFKYLRVGITPKSSTGTTTGIEVKSEFSQIAVSTTMVHFIYNGQEVAYGIITSSITGRQWLDRNLGAQRAATSYIDYQAYGDLFQWGRLDDGHQVVIWSAVHGTSFVSSTTETLSSSDVPGNALFFIDPSFSSPNADWRNQLNDNLWQMVEGHKGINDPCPAGWHIPTNAEWNAEIAGTEAVGTVLKLTSTGYRPWGSGAIIFNGDAAPTETGHYWSSTVIEDGGFHQGVRYWFRPLKPGTEIAFDLAYRSPEVRVSGLACRCIKD